MKTLLLLRHGKAAEGTAGQADLDRTLTERGRDQAQAIGQFIKERDLQLDLVLCSPAARAKETAELVLAAAGLTTELRDEPRIYEASSIQLFDLVLHLDASVGSVLLVGHNPGFEDLVHLITDRVSPLSTCTLARIEIQADGWSDVAEVSGKLDWVVRSEDLLEEKS